MINQVVYVGRLTKNPVLRKTAKGISVCSFTIAVERYRGSDLEKATVDYIPCVAWRAWADNLCEYQTKGSLIAVKGSTQSRSYDDENGKKIFVNGCITQEIQFLETQSIIQDRKNKQEETYEPFTDSPFENKEEDVELPY